MYIKLANGKTGKYSSLKPRRRQIGFTYFDEYDKRLFLKNPALVYYNLGQETLVYVVDISLNVSYRVNKIYADTKVVFLEECYNIIQTYKFVKPICKLEKI